MQTGDTGMHRLGAWTVSELMACNAYVPMSAALIANDSQPQKEKVFECKPHIHLSLLDVSR